MQASESAGGGVRRFFILLLILGLGIAVFFVGRMIYRFGQNAAAQLAGADVHSTMTALPPVQPRATTTVPSTASALPTYAFPPTATATIIPWTICPGIVVSVSDTKAGSTVHIRRCSDGLEYDIGPLVRGVYAVSPDDKYFVYCGINGVIYAARIGNATLTQIHDAHREFYTFGQDMEPIFKLSFDGPHVLKVYESRFGQNLPLRMPSWLDNY